MWIVKEEALRLGEGLLNEMPELRTNDYISWNKEGVGENFRMLCILLKGNAIPTQSLDLQRKALIKLRGGAVIVMIEVWN